MAYQRIIRGLVRDVTGNWIRRILEAGLQKAKARFDSQMFLSRTRLIHLLIMFLCFHFTSLFPNIYTLPTARANNLVTH